jgi:hypothetical protein
MAAKKSTACLTVDEALDTARTRDDVRTVELIVIPNQLRVRVAEHQKTFAAVYSLQRYNEEKGRWYGATLWARDLTALYNEVLDFEGQDYLDCSGWKPVYFSF